VTRTSNKEGRVFHAATLACLINSLFYFHQYALRSAPSVMVPELSAGFGASAVELASLLRLFYYGLIRSVHGG